MTSGNLSANQRALLHELLTGKRKLVLCVGGFAAWRSDIEWSQGRTPSNAVSDADVQALQRAGYLEDAGFGAVRPTFNAFYENRGKPTEHQPWVPANEGYTGEALIP